MFQNSIVHCHKYRKYVEHQFPQRHTIAPLMWSSHEQYTICREFDRSMPFQSALSGSIRVDQSLCKLELRAGIFSLSRRFTFLTTILFKPWATKIIGRVSLYEVLRKWRSSKRLIIIIPLSTFFSGINRPSRSSRDRIDTGSDLRTTVGIGIIAPIENPCIFNIQRKKITKPVDSVHGSGIFTMSVELMHGDNCLFKRWVISVGRYTQVLFIQVPDRFHLQGSWVQTETEWTWTTKLLLVEVQSIDR